MRQHRHDVGRARHGRHGRGGRVLERGGSRDQGVRMEDDDEGRWGQVQLGDEQRTGLGRLERVEGEPAGLEARPGPRRERQGHEKDDAPGHDDGPTMPVDARSEPLESAHPMVRRQGSGRVMRRPMLPKDRPRPLRRRGALRRPPRADVSASISSVLLARPAEAFRWTCSSCRSTIRCPSGSRPASPGSCSSSGCDRHPPPRVARPAGSGRSRTPTRDFLFAMLFVGWALVFGIGLQLVPHEGADSPYGGFAPDRAVQRLLHHDGPALVDHRRIADPRRASRAADVARTRRPFRPNATDTFPGPPFEPVTGPNRGVPAPAEHGQSGSSPRASNRPSDPASRSPELHLAVSAAGKRQRWERAAGATARGPWPGAPPHRHSTPDAGPGPDLRAIIRAIQSA